MEPRAVAVIGGSAGALGPLRQLATALPAGLPASVLVTLHVSIRARGELPWLLSHSGPLPAEHAREGERLQSGRVYVARPGRHLLVPGGVVELSNGPKVNHFRPAVDAMFASAARWFGDRVVAVVLSGLLDDGGACRCHVGHQFGPQSLVAAQADAAEAKLWSAVAALEETAAMARHSVLGVSDGDADQQASTADRATAAEGTPPRP